MAETENTRKPGYPLNRRQFLAGAVPAALTFTIMKPAQVRGSVANSKVNFGLVGCGARGSWIGSLFQENGGFQAVAVADYFADRASACGDKLKVDATRRYTGLSGYQQLIDSEVDAVVIETPPYFHPIQAAAAVDAGKHVYLAKPIAVDVPGCRTVLESGKKARANRLAFLIDFQTRANPLFQEALKRVHEGAIGTLAFGEAAYHAENPWQNQVAYLTEDARNPENRLRAWGLDRTLSGDIITEQNIHTLDVMNWIMHEPPVSAWGTGGHSARTDPGSCWDHFTVLYQYPKGVGVTFSSRQFEGHGAWEGIHNRMFGSTGMLETDYFGEVIIRGKNPYPGGTTGGIYGDAVIVNIATFHRDITEGRFDNPTLEPSVQSNMITLLGRKAAYENRVVTWQEIESDSERLAPDLKGLKE